jgi:hypothetical protein
MYTKFKYIGNVLREDGKSNCDIIQQIAEAKVMFNDENQLLCSNNISFVIKKRRIQSGIWGVVIS